jgi:hypothetical protein
MTPSDRDAVQFTRESAERIANVVRAAELTPTRGRALSFEAIQQSASRKTFRMATFTGAWSINGTKTVTLRGSTATLSAVNLVCGLNPTGSCDASIAKDGTAWYLVQPNLTQQPGYSASGTQVMTIVDGSLMWFGVATCSTATASP